MARWQPEVDKPIGPNEHLGRRLFDEPLLVGARDQKPLVGLPLSHFEERRDGGEVSLDRLGHSGIDKKVTNFLAPLAGAAGTTFHPPRRFDGWAVIKARLLSAPPRGDVVLVVPSPAAEPGTVANVYHAHVSPCGKDSYEMALHLRHLFVTYGTTHSVRPGHKTQDLLGRVIAWVIGKVGWKRLGEP